MYLIGGSENIDHTIGYAYVCSSSQVNIRIVETTKPSLHKILLIPVCLLSFITYGQKAYLKHHKKEIQLSQRQSIGITTLTDTIPYSEKPEQAYEISAIGNESITVRKIARTEDTIVTGIYDLSILPREMDYRLVKWYKKDKVQYCRLKKVISYSYKTIAYADMTSIRYANNHGNGDGCIGCFFIPGLNIYYILRTKEYIRKYDLKKWQLRVERS